MHQIAKIPRFIVQKCPRPRRTRRCRSTEFARSRLTTSTDRHRVLRRWTIPVARHQFFDGATSNTALAHPFSFSRTGGRPSLLLARRSQSASLDNVQIISFSAQSSNESSSRRLALSRRVSPSIGRFRQRRRSPRVYTKGRKERLPSVYDPLVAIAQHVSSYPR